jgi:outer membrane protein insertion porin family
VKPYIGEDFTLELFWEIQGLLYELDYFEEVSADAEPGDEDYTSVIIAFSVTERPTVVDVELAGNRRLSRSVLLDRILVKKGDFVTQSEVDLDAVSIEELYLEKGFPEVQVKGSLDLDEEENTVAVTFAIAEGSETKIKSISFSGNNFASDSTLRGVMTTKVQSLFRSGVFRENILEEDKLAIERYYKNHGFVDAAVVEVDREIETDEEAGRTQLLLTVYVEEGEQYTFGGMSFEGNEVFANQQLADLVRIKPGEVLNQEKVDNAYERVWSLYRDNGYIYNAMQREEIRDEEAREIAYHVIIAEADKAHIESIVLRGNVKTEDYVIYRELPFEVGDIFSVEKIRQGVLNLYNLQYFSSVNPQPVQGSFPGLMDLIIDVEEQSWADFKFGLTFSGGEFPFAGQFGWSDRNFLGTGRTIGVDIEAAATRQGTAFNFQDNYLFGKDWGGGLSLSVFRNVVSNIYQDIIPPIFADVDVPDPYISEADFQAALEGGLEIPASATMQYDTIDVSASVNTSYFARSSLGRLGITTTLSSTATYLWYDPEIYRPYNQTVRDNLLNWNFVNSWGTTFFWDNRDIFFNPTTGFYLSQFVGLTGGFLQGSRHFAKLRSRAEGFLTLFSVPMGETFDLEMILALHSSVSFIFPQIGGLLELTPKDMLAIDGMTIGRGWPFRAEFKALWDSNVELRSPIVRQFLWWTWFFDVVGAWTDVAQMGSMDIEDYYFSFGAGLRFTMPGLPIRLYFSSNFKVTDGAVVWEDGDFKIGSLGLKFVIAFSRPGGF